MKLGEYGVLPRTKRSNGNRATLWHMAPEGFKGKMELKSDVWSLGISLFELASRQRAYASSERNPEEIIPDSYPPSLYEGKWSAPFCDFLSKCLEKVVNQRASVSELMNVATRGENDE